MQHFFINANQKENDIIKILGNDVNHIKNVLRCKVNEKLEISVIETEERFLAEILELNKENIICKVVEKIDADFESNVNLNIIQALPKADKMELIIQKCTELGVKEITPLELERCIVKISGKDVDKKLERWQTIAETAAKQCRRSIIPKINNLYNLKNIEEIIKKNDLVILAYENETENSLKDVINELKFKNLQQELSFAALNNFGNIKRETETDDNISIGIIIGPEGGLVEKEVEYLKNLGVKSVSLGKRILRTETVAIVLASIIMYELGNLGEICDYSGPNL